LTSSWRQRAATCRKAALVEKDVYGLAFLINGNMSAGVL
jgi:hypothetical protein